MARTKLWLTSVCIPAALTAAITLSGSSDSMAIVLIGTPSTSKSVTSAMQPCNV